MIDLGWAQAASLLVLSRLIDIVTRFEILFLELVPAKATTSILASEEFHELCQREFILTATENYVLSDSLDDLAQIVYVVRSWLIK